MFNFFKKKKPVSLFNQISIPRKDAEFSSKAKAFLNPTWEIEVKDAQGNSVLKLPFCFWIHTRLKDYGFDPDNKLMNPSATVILRLAPQKKGQPPSEAKLPLYLYNEKDLPDNWKG